MKENFVSCLEYSAINFFPKTVHLSDEASLMSDLTSFRNDAGFV